MSWSSKVGTALRALCLPLFVSALGACGEHAQREAQAHAQPKIEKTKESEEAFALVEATKNNPSLQPGSNQAGPPIHVNPYPKSAGMKHDDHAHHDIPMH